MSNMDSIEGVDGFERFSMRLARALLIVSIAVGCLALVGGLLIAGGVWLKPEPRKPDPPAAPVPEKLALSHATRWASEHGDQVKSYEDELRALREPGALPARIAALFPTPPYVAADVIEDYCKVPSAYGCLQKGHRITTPVPARYYNAALGTAKPEVTNEMLGVLEASSPPSRSAPAPA